MCSPKIPNNNEINFNKAQVAAPTYADAKITKGTSNIRNRAAALAGRDIKTSTRGLSDSAVTEKKELLGA